MERASLASAFGSLVISNLDRKYTPGVGTDYTVAQLTARHLCRVTQGAETVWEGYLQAPEFIIDRFVDEVSWELVGKVKGNLPSGDATTYRVRLPNVDIDNQVSDLIDAWFVKFGDVTREPALLTDFSIGAVAWDNNAIEFLNECAAFEGGFTYETLDGKLAVLSEARLAGETPQYVSPATITIIHPAVEKPDIGRLYNRAVITSTQAVKESEETLLSLGGFRVPASGNLTDTYFVAEDFENPLYTIDWTTPIVLNSDTLIQHRANTTDTYDVNTRVTGDLTVTIVDASTSENRVRLVITNTANFEKYIELLLVSGRPTRNLADVSQRTYSDSVGITAYGLRELILRPFLRWFRKTGLRRLYYPRNAVGDAEGSSGIDLPAMAGHTSAGRRHPRHSAWQLHPSHARRVAEAVDCSGHRDHLQLGHCSKEDRLLPRDRRSHGGWRRVHTGYVPTG